MLMDILYPIYRAFGAIGYFFYLTWYTIERIVLIHPIETAMRIWYWLDPRVHAQALRIREVTDGRPKKDNAFYILVLYARAPLPAITQNIIDTIAQSAHNLIVVSNAPLEPLLKAQLSETCHKVIERANIGRDFGAYKDGIAYVLEHYPDAERIVLMNDSVFFLKRSLDKLVEDLNAPHDFIGITEVHQFHYHVQSFMLSFGKNALKSKAFRKFWKGYLPLNTRRWAVHKGEVRLTRQLTKAGFRPHIIYQAAHLIPQLQRRPAREIIESIRLLPVRVRDGLMTSFLSVFGEQPRPAAMAMLEAVSYGVRRLQPGPRRDTENRLVEISNQAAAMDQWSLGIFPNMIVYSISKHNQMHHGCFLFIKYLGLPLIKRDIFYRELYSLEDVYRFLSDIGEPLRDDILSDLRRSGSGSHLRGFKRLLYRHGSL